VRCIFLIFALCAAAAPCRAGQITVNFKTVDGCAIVAFYLAPSSGSYVFINTHGLGSDRNEWAGFQDALGKRGLGYLSIDMRGHGASLNCSGKKVSYRAFSKADWSSISRDIEAAAAWLKKKKIPASRLVFCGASIGANLSLKAAAEGLTKPAAVVLLSAGLEYAGVQAAPYLPGGRQPGIFMAAAADDPYAWQSAGLLAQTAGRKGADLYYTAARSGHGVNMFKAPELMTDILDWVLKSGRPAAAEK